MPVYYFRTSNGQSSDWSDHGTEFADHAAAWDEMTKVCGDLVGGIVRKIDQNAKWQIELLDEAKRPVFRIALIAETLDK